MHSCWTAPPRLNTAQRQRQLTLTPHPSSAPHRLALRKQLARGVRRPKQLAALLHPRLCSNQHKQGRGLAGAAGGTKLLQAEQRQPGPCAERRGATPRCATSTSSTAAARGSPDHRPSAPLASRSRPSRRCRTASTAACALSTAGLRASTSRRASGLSRQNQTCGEQDGGGPGQGCVGGRRQMKAA